MKKFKSRLFKNIEYRILALVIAFFTWLIVTNIVDYKVTKTFNGITVEQQNGDVILQNGKVYDVTAGEETSIVVKGPRSIVDELSVNDFTASADLSQLSITNSAEINVICNRSNIADKISITTLVKQMTLSIEDKAEASLPVKVYKTGAVAKGYAVGNISTTPNIVTVTGPESVLKTITEVRAAVSVDGLSATGVQTATLGCVDAYGRAVDKVNVTLSSKEISVTVPIYPLKNVPVIVSTKGTPAEGYAVKNVEYNPETVKIAGKDDVIKDIAKINIDDIDVTDATSDVEVNEQISNYLPDDTYLEDSSAVIAVNVMIEKLVDHEITFEPEDIYLFGENDDYTYTLSLDDGDTLNLNGFEDSVKNIKAEDLNPRIDMSGLEPGTYDKVIVFTKNDDYTIDGYVTAKIVIKKKTKESSTAATTESGAEK